MVLIYGVSSAVLGIYDLIACLHASASFCYAQKSLCGM